MVCGHLVDTDQLRKFGGQAQSNQWEPLKLFEPMVSASEESFRAVAETFDSARQVAR